MNCPKCQIDVDDNLEQCPGCGIFFNKWREREDNVAAGNVSRYSTLAAATSSEFNWTILVIICVVLVGVLFFVKYRLIE